MAPIVLQNRHESYQNASITAPNKGIEGTNAIRVLSLGLTNVKIRSLNYSLYCGNCGPATVSWCDFETTGGGDDYTVRGVFDSWLSDNNRFVCSGIKAAGRFPNCLSFRSYRDLWQGGRLMLGGGYSVESVDPGTFVGTFEECKIRVASVEVYPKSTVTFKKVDFTGTGHCTPWTGCSILCIGCTKDGAPLTAAFFKNAAAGVTIQ